MCKKKSVRKGWEQVGKFNKFLVFYSNDEEGTGIKGIRSDAPPEMIEEFISWYRNINRYDNGRIRPLSDGLIKRIVIKVDA